MMDRRPDTMLGQGFFHFYGRRGVPLSLEVAVLMKEPDRRAIILLLHSRPKALFHPVVLFRLLRDLGDILDLAQAIHQLALPRQVTEITVGSCFHDRFFRTRSMKFRPFSEL